MEESEKQLVSYMLQAPRCSSNDDDQLVGRLCVTELSDQLGELGNARETLGSCGWQIGLVDNLIDHNTGSSTCPFARNTAEWIPSHASNEVTDSLSS